jgi:general L-amino acid transport system substrate-binding protein
VPLTTAARFPALQSGEVDMLSRTTALTITRDASLGLNVTVATFFTGQGVLVNRRLNVTTLRQMDGATVCTVQASEIERNIADYARANNIRLITVGFDTQETVTSAFLAGRCDAISNDMLNLSGSRLRAPNPDDYVLLSEFVAKEPHGILVRNGDAEWAAITRWAFMALLQAEEFGLTRANVEAARRDSQDPKVQRFLGRIENVGTGLGLPATWAYEVVRQDGSYAEIYDRHIGPAGLGIERGVNRLWTQGGMHMSWLWQ